MTKSFVVLGSANGSRNLGDECMWESLVGFLRATFPDCHIVTDGKPDWDPPIEKVTVLPTLAVAMKIDPAKHPKLATVLGRTVVGRALSRFNRARRVRRLVLDRLRYGPRTDLEKQWQNAVATADAFLVSGAGAMTDQYDVQGIHSWHLLASWAKEHSKPVLLLGQGVGPVEKKTNRIALGELLAIADYVGVREERSRDYALELQAHIPHIEVTPDWAAGLRMTAVARAKAAAIRAELLSSEPYFAVSLHLHQPWAFLRRRKLMAMTRLIAIEAERRNRRLLFVPNMTGQGHSDDRRLAQQLIDALPDALANRCAIHSGQSDALVVRALIASSTGIISTRYHPLVFALMERTPAVGIYFDDYYERKLVGAFKAAEVRSNVFPFTRNAAGVGVWFDRLEALDVKETDPEEIEAALFTPVRLLLCQSE